MISVGNGACPERVTCHNAENGLCVLRVEACGQRVLVAIVERPAIITAGEFQAVASSRHPKRPLVKSAAGFVGLGADREGHEHECPERDVMVQVCPPSQGCPVNPRAMPAVV